MEEWTFLIQSAKQTTQHPWILNSAISRENSFFGFSNSWQNEELYWYLRRDIYA